MMSYSRRRYSRSASPHKGYRRSISGLRSRSRSASRDVENPGNNLYVTGLSPRVTKRELEKHFSTEGKVIDIHLVVDPWTRESRGFGFVTMATVEEAECCIKHLDRSVLEGRVITVEKFLWQQARRRRGRTPTPGRYMGLRTIRVHRRTPSYSPTGRSPSYSPYHRGRSRFSYSSERSHSRSYSPYYRRGRSHSRYSRRRSYMPYYSRRCSYSRSHSPYSRSPDDRNHRRGDRSYSPYDFRYDDIYHQRRDRSYTPEDFRYDSPDNRYYRRHRFHSVSRSPTPPRRRSSRRSYSCSVTPKRRTSYRRSYSRSISPRRTRRRCSPSISPRPMKSVCRGGSSKGGNSLESYSRSPCKSSSASSRSVSRSVSSRSASPST